MVKNILFFKILKASSPLELIGRGMEMAAGLQDRLEFLRSNLIPNFDKTYQNLDFICSNPVPSQKILIRILLNTDQFRWGFRIFLFSDLEFPFFFKNLQSDIRLLWLYLNINNHLFSVQIWQFHLRRNFDERRKFHCRGHFGWQSNHSVGYTHLDLKNSPFVQINWSCKRRFRSSRYVRTTNNLLNQLNWSSRLKTYTSMINFYFCGYPKWSQSLTASSGQWQRESVTKSLCLSDSLWQ